MCYGRVAVCQSEVEDHNFNGNQAWQAEDLGLESWKIQMEVDLVNQRSL